MSVRKLSHVAYVLNPHSNFALIRISWAWLCLDQTFSFMKWVAGSLYNRRRGSACLNFKHGTFDIVIAIGLN
jgi:hypothetical protein